MRSLLLRILLASLGTVLASLAAFLITFFAMAGPATERLIRHFQARQIEDAIAALQRGGPAETASYLDRLNRSLGATHYLTDSAGRDVVSGEDRSALLHTPRRRFGPPQLDGRIIVVNPSSDGRHRMIILAPPPFDIWAFAPYYALILAAIALLCFSLAIGIATPLRELADAVDRFGRGDLSTRVPAVRRDEIGNLARAFNHMAVRIETLMTAERRLLQDISHELRSPLARLNIAIELARTADDRDAAAARLQKEVNRLTSLVGSLLEVTRVEGDPSTRRSELVRVSDILHDVVQSCMLESEARKCHLVISSTSGRTLHGDPELLRRALENVVRNAIRFAPPNSDVELETDDSPSGVVITVRDKGKGVPDDLLPRLSQPFFRVEDARDFSSSGGVGLGLSIAHRAVQLHHGTLVAENAHPGLRVTLTFPDTAAGAA
ncbi:MAG TPA: ATP-binding protein [Vicinamibacterales bacterium]|nr:ATP-binding protein [Vicinamibacterales bacterium]